MAATRCALLCALVAVCATGALASRSSDYDYFLFVRQWGVTFCQHGSCAIKPVERFSVHGLWPERNDGSWPQCCNSHYRFHVGQIINLLPELERVWFSYTYGIKDQCVWEAQDSAAGDAAAARRLLADGEGAPQPANGTQGAGAALRGDSPNYQFWRHEWEKHGTCCLDALGGENSYFWAVLHLHRRHDLDAALRNQGITPRRKPYSTRDVLRALRDEIGADVTFSCRDGEINEVRVCVDKRLQLMDCPGAAHPYGCNDTVVIPRADSRLA